MNGALSAGAVWAAMLALILDGKTAVSSARQGVALCLSTVIPSLFPFLVLSGEMTDLPFLRPLGRLLGIPGPLLLPAFLGGYPAGAQSLGAAWRAGQLSKPEAEKMLAFCNNCGPAFLFAMAGPLFPEKWMAWALWGIHLTGAVLTARLFPAAGETAPPLPRRPGDALLRGEKVMGVICGWVVLFRVIMGFLKRWVLFWVPGEAQVVIMGLLELTNGCCALAEVESLTARFTLCSLLLALGGLCVAMQTGAVTRGLSLRFYYQGKALQGLFSVLLSLGLLKSPLFLIPVLLILLGKHREKSSSIPAVLGV